MDAAGVEALGECQVGQVGGEVAVAASAAVPGEGDDQIDGVSGAGVAQVVECAGADGVASGGSVALRTGAGLGVPGAVPNQGFGKVFDAGDAFGGIGNILAWTWHTPTS